MRLKGIRKNWIGYIGAPLVLALACILVSSESQASVTVSYAYVRCPFQLMNQANKVSEFNNKVFAVLEHFKNKQIPPDFSILSFDCVPNSGVDAMGAVELDIRKPVSELVEHLVQVSRQGHAAKLLRFRVRHLDVLRSVACFGFAEACLRQYEVLIESGSLEILESLGIERVVFEFRDEERTDAGFAGENGLHIGEPVSDQEFRHRLAGRVKMDSTQHWLLFLKPLEKQFRVTINPPPEGGDVERTVGMLADVLPLVLGTETPIRSIDLGPEMKPLTASTVGLAVPASIDEIRDFMVSQVESQRPDYIQRREHLIERRLGLPVFCRNRVEFCQMELDRIDQVILGRPGLQMSSKNKILVLVEDGFAMNQSFAKLGLVPVGMDTTDDELVRRLPEGFGHE